MEARKTDIQDKNNLERLLFKGIKNWKIFLFSFTVGLTSVYLIDRYTTPVYAVSSTIILKEKSNELAGSAAELLFGNKQFNNAMNLNNESIILKSYPLIYKVIDKLKLDVSYYSSGNVKTSEIFDNIPISVLVDSASSSVPYNKLFKVEILNEDEFHLFEEKENSNQINGIYRFNESLKIDNFNFQIINHPNIINYLGKSFLFEIRSLDDVTNEYRNKLLIKANGRESSTLTLTINSRLVEKEKLFLKELIDIYIRSGLEEKNRNSSRTIEFIDQQLQSIEDSLFLTERKLELFKRDKGIINLSEEGARLYNKVDDFVAKKTALINKVNYYDYLQNYLAKSDLSDDIVPPSNAGANDPVLNKLVMELIELQGEKNIISVESAENPYLNILRSQAENIRKDIDTVLKNMKSKTNLEQKQLDLEWRKIEAEISKLPAAEREYIHINRMYELNENLYIFLMEKKAEAAILKASSTPDVKVVDPPMASGGKIAPRTSNNLGIAIVLSLIFPIAFLYFKEFFNTKILYKEDIDSVTDIPFLGLVGHEASDDNIIVSKYPRSAVSESFRTIRSNINFFTGGKENRTILITSSISGEGKTFCSINLSTVFALSGQNTVIVGADLRRPKLFTDFNLENKIGVSNYLIGDANVDEIVQPTAIDNLDLISSGAVPPNPSELLMSEQMDQLIKELQQKYDNVILDTPPIGLVTDALILMKHSDLNVYIVRQNYTPKGSIMNTQEMYENGQLKDMSILFNDVKVQKYGYGYGYGYNYGYNYSYYSQNRPSKKAWYKFW